MNHDFWLEKWQAGDIGFHEGSTNLLLAAHVEKLRLAEGDRVFLPLCGKTRDISFLLDRGYRILGSELSERAVRELFDELGLIPRISKLGEHMRFSAKHIDIFVGDIFTLTSELIEAVDAVYDRAALVALPADLRKRYTAHLITLTGAAPQLLLSLRYDEAQADGPPFSISEEEVKRHYEKTYQARLLDSRVLPEVFGSRTEVTESAWLLS